MFNTKLLPFISMLLLCGGCAALMLNIPSEVEKNAINNGAPVYIGAIGVGLPNSAGGKQITFIWKNIGDREIKYLTINTNLYNRVDDRVRCRIGFGGSVRFTGPVDAGSYRRGNPRSLCYDSNAVRGEVRSIRVVYMDDSSQTFEREDLLKMGALHERA